ncbi:Tn3 family transposase [Microtetraspora fusca]|uniref:Tn3 family transposase n=1 Tax=Microtetraspora fusca TaxID=1997 RepID=UPI000A5D094E|nr:Tn3 family transposase [Microtetraspora fusca]
MPLEWLELRSRPGNQGAIKLSPLEALPEPRNLGRLKKVIIGRWGTVPLIDVLKEAVLRSNCQATIASMFGREITGQMLERLSLVLYAYGTNTGIRAVAAGEHGHREDAAELAAMIDGAVRHGTAMDVEASYTDTHGQSIIGFGRTRLLGFDLPPRIKQINRVRLYRPGHADAYPNLGAAMMSRPIRWNLIADQYVQMIKYATAIRTRPTQTAAILRRFRQTNVMQMASAA